MEPAEMEGGNSLIAEFTGTQKAAILLIALGPEKSSAIFKHLNDDQLSAIEARIHSEYEALKEKCELTQVREDM